MDAFTQCIDVHPRTKKCATLEEYATVHRLCPRSKEQWEAIEKVLNLRQHQRWEEAVELFTECSDIHPKTPKCRNFDEYVQVHLPYDQWEIDEFNQHWDELEAIFSHHLGKRKTARVLKSDIEAQCALLHPKTGMCSSLKEFVAVHRPSQLTKAGELKIERNLKMHQYQERNEEIGTLYTKCSDVHPRTSKCRNFDEYIELHTPSSWAGKWEFNDHLNELEAIFSEIGQGKRSKLDTPASIFAQCVNVHPHTALCSSFDKFMSTHHIDKRTPAQLQKIEKIFDNQQRWEEAMEHFTKCSDLHPDSKMCRNFDEYVRVHTPYDKWEIEEFAKYFVEIEEMFSQQFGKGKKTKFVPLKVVWAVQEPQAIVCQTRSRLRPGRPDCRHILEGRRCPNKKCTFNHP